MPKPGKIAPKIPAAPATPASPAAPATPAAKVAVDLAPMIRESVTLAVSMLGIKTDAMLSVGESLDNILKTAKENPGEWTRKKFDNVISEWNTEFRTREGQTGLGSDGMLFWSVFAIRAALVTLGIPEPERVASARLAKLANHAIVLDKLAIAGVVRPQWSEWLIEAIPANYSGPDAMTKDDFTSSIADMTAALVASDKEYKAPRARGSKPATKTKTKTSAPRATADASKPANVSPSVPPVGKPAAPATPASPAATPDSPFTALAAILATGKPGERKQIATMLGLALVKANDLDAMQAIYKIVKPVIMADREARKPRLGATG